MCVGRFNRMLEAAGGVNYHWVRVKTPKNNCQPRFSDHIHSYRHQIWMWCNI